MCAGERRPFDVRQSMRPLVSWALWNFARQLPASKQIHFFRSLLNDHLPAESLAIPGLGNQFWVQSQTVALLKRWDLGDDIHRRELKRIFYSEDLTEPLAFDLTVEVADSGLAARTLNSLKKWMAFQGYHRVLFASPGRLLALPEGIPVDVPAKEIQTRRHVILACDWPKVKDVRSLKSHFLFALRVCGEDKLPSWRELMASTPSDPVRTANNR